LSYTLLFLFSAIVFRLPFYTRPLTKGPFWTSLSLLSCPPKILLPAHASRLPSLLEAFFHRTYILGFPASRRSGIPFHNTANVPPTPVQTRMLSFTRRAHFSISLLPVFFLQPDFFWTDSGQEGHFGLMSAYFLPFQIGIFKLQDTPSLSIQWIRTCPLEVWFLPLPFPLFVLYGLRTINQYVHISVRQDPMLCDLPSGYLTFLLSPPFLNFKHPLGIVEFFPPPSADNFPPLHRTSNCFLLELFKWDFSFEFVHAPVEQPFFPILCRTFRRKVEKQHLSFRSPPSWCSDFAFPFFYFSFKKNGPPPPHPQAGTIFTYISSRDRGALFVPGCRGDLIFMFFFLYLCVWLASSSLPGPFQLRSECRGWLAIPLGHSAPVVLGIAGSIFPKCFVSPPPSYRYRGVSRGCSSFFSFQFPCLLVTQISFCGSALIACYFEWACKWVRQNWSLRRLNVFFFGIFLRPGAVFSGSVCQSTSRLYYRSLSVFLGPRWECFFLC